MNFKEKTDEDEKKSKYIRQKNPALNQRSENGLKETKLNEALSNDKKDFKFNFLIE